MRNAVVGETVAAYSPKYEEPTEQATTWDDALVRGWLDSRIESSRLDQAVADRRGYEARDDYDKAAAEEWACRALSVGDGANTQTALAGRIKELIAEDAYRVTGIDDHERFERHVRTCLRKIARMVKANTGFENRSRYQ